MAAPNLQAEGTIDAVTTGNLTVVLPAHEAGDILIVMLAYHAPNTAGSTGAPGEPAGWAYGSDLEEGDAEVDSRAIWYWKRAASGAEPDPTFTRPSPMDTGTDTNWSGRAYVIRGCVATGDPWDATARTQPGYIAANGALPAVTVSGDERTVVQFVCSNDDQAAGAAPSGWTAGTEATTTTGTGGGFQTFTKNRVAASTAADVSAVAAPAQGIYGFFGVSFRPPDVGGGRSQSLDYDYSRRT